MNLKRIEATYEKHSTEVLIKNKERLEQELDWQLAYMMDCARRGDEEWFKCAEQGYRDKLEYVLRVTMAIEMRSKTNEVK